MGYELGGTATQVNGQIRLESVCGATPGTGTFGEVNFTIPRNAFSFGDITVLEALYTLAEGSTALCEAGTPRFSLLAADGRTVFVELGPAADPSTCTAGQNNPGNLLDPASTAERFFVDGVAMTYAEALAATQGRVFTDIYFVVDPSHCGVGEEGERQRVLVNPCVNVRA